MGFTKNSNRLCVALSRAKKTMTVIAHPAVVNVIPELKAFRAAAFQERVYRLHVRLLLMDLMEAYATLSGDSSAVTRKVRRAVKLMVSGVDS